MEISQLATFEVSEDCVTLVSDRDTVHCVD